MPDGPLRGGVVVIEARGLVVEKLPPLVVRRPFPVFFFKEQIHNEERAFRSWTNGLERARRRRNNHGGTRLVGCDARRTKYLLHVVPEMQATRNRP